MLKTVVLYYAWAPKPRIFISCLYIYIIFIACPWNFPKSARVLHSVDFFCVWGMAFKFGTYSYRANIA